MACRPARVDPPVPSRYKGGVAGTQELSAGGLVLREVDGRVELAVIKPAGRGVLALPKGHLDPGETPEQAATREVREETGLSARLDCKLGDVKYVYRWRGKNIFKCVSFFLFRHEGGVIDALTPMMRAEVDVARWIPLADAVTQLSYPGEREMAQKALEAGARKP